MTIYTDIPQCTSARTGYANGLAPSEAAQARALRIELGTMKQQSLSLYRSD